MRIVVVGAGVIGLLTAVECVRAGARVDLVDQADIPSAAAASYDRHRVVRTLHRGDPPLTLAAARLHEDWLEVRRFLGSRFYYRTGVLTALPVSDVESTLGVLAEADVPVDALSADDLAARYPHLRFEPGQAAVLERSAGTVLADRALHAMARWLHSQAAVRLHRCRQVAEVSGSGEVRLADGTVLTGDAVVVAAGPWSRDLLPSALAAELTLMRQTVVTCAPTSWHSAWAGSPAVLGLGSAQDAWLMPPVADTPLRLSAASACRAVPDLTGHETPREWLDHLTDRFGTVLTGFDPATVTGATDAYYLAGGPLLAELGDAVWAYAACGGMSFKFAPSVARALADRATGRPPRSTGLDAVDRPRQFAAVHTRRRPS